MKLVVVVSWAVAAATGCSTIYDAQYTDRESQLDQARVVFLDGSTNVSFFSAGEDLLYWLDAPQPAQIDELHSVDTRGSSVQVDYAWSENMVTSASAALNLGLGDQLVVECEAGVAFDATNGSETVSPYVPLDVFGLGGADSGSTPCVVTGGSADYIGSDAIVAWQPSQGSNVTTVASLGAIPADGNGFGFADATEILYEEDTELFLVPTNGSPPNQPLNPVTAQVGTTVIAFDDEGVVFVDSNDNVDYIRYTSPDQVISVADLITNGGYSINFDHADVQDLDSSGTYTMFDHHLIYQGNGGIFALGFDTGNVVDLLLDGLPDADGDVVPNYAGPTVTNNGSLFVQDEATVDNDLHPVYRIDLTGRLK